MRTLIAACSALLVMSACAHRGQSPGELLDTWKGAPRSALLDKLGKPDRSVADGSGGEILVYRYDETTTVYEPDLTKKMGTRAGGIDEKVAGYIVVREFHLDSKGLVYDVEERKERIGLSKWDADAVR
jgi:hypothetical protein